MQNRFDVIIIGGSIAGISAALTLGRALRQVLVVDSGTPCNRQTPKSHNFLSRDGIPPLELIATSREQLARYENVTWLEGIANAAAGSDGEFEVTVGDRRFQSSKILLATGLRDLFPDIDGFKNCWGISVLHCPYCHGYEVRQETTAVLANGEAAYHLGTLIHHWTRKLVVLTNGVSELRLEEAQKLETLGIEINEKNIVKLVHNNGLLGKVQFEDGAVLPMKVIYASIPFEQQSDLGEKLLCKISSHKHIEVDDQQRTSIPGVFAAGDCTQEQRAVSVAAASGTIAGFTINLELLLNEKMPSDK